MIPLIGYDASYQWRAFKSKIDPDGLPRQALESSLEHAIGAVQAKSDRRWNIVIKTGFIPFDRSEPIELMVIVPAGNDQYDQFLAAVKMFEDCMTGAPFSDPLDTTLRTIEADGPKCEKCGANADWLCRTQFSGDAHFCDQHAKEDPHFEAPYFLWFRHESADAIT